MLEVTITASKSLNNLLTKLVAVNQNVGVALEKAAFLGIGKVQQLAKDKVPVRTGNLRRSIVIAALGKFSWMCHTGDVVYAASHEYDNSFNHFRDLKGHPPQGNANAQWGYMRKSLAEVKPIFINKIREIAKELIRKRA